MKMFHQILNKDQAKVLRNLSSLKDYTFYLGGGTALALQLGHRTSLDFDFYTGKHFDSDSLFEKLESIFGKRAVKTSKAKNTLFCRLENVENSFFWYKYKLLKKPTKINEVQIASLHDIAAMKLVAVSGRPAKRDYIDIFYLLKVFTLKEMFGFAEKKYPNFNSYYTLRALSFFEDIKEQETKRPIMVLDKDFSWEKAKEKIFEEVKKYQLSMLKEK